MARIRKNAVPPKNSTLFLFARVLKLCMTQDYTIVQLCKALGMEPNASNRARLGTYMMIMEYVGLTRKVGQVERTPGQPGTAPTLWGVWK